MRKNILTTGDSGFLGRYILKALNDENIYSIRRKSISEESDKSIIIDLSNSIPQLPNILFDKVVHIAGKAHSVPKNEKENKEFFEVNLKGTTNLIDGIKQLNQQPKSFIFISTVAVYGKSTGILINENIEPIPNTPYGASKFQAEKAIEQYCTQNNINFYILRLPLIIGKDAPGNFGAMSNAIRTGRYIRVSNNFVQKSMVAANDIGNLINQIDRSYPSGIYNLTDSYNPTFFELEQKLSIFFQKRILFVIPKSILQILAKIGDFLIKFRIKFPLDSLRLSKITSSLTFDTTKAVSRLNWKPTNILENLDNILK